MTAPLYGSCHTSAHAHPLWPRALDDPSSPGSALLKALSGGAPVHYTVQHFRGHLRGRKEVQIIGFSSTHVLSVDQLQPQSFQDAAFADVDAPEILELSEAVQVRRLRRTDRQHPKLGVTAWNIRAPHPIKGELAATAAPRPDGMACVTNRNKARQN